ncbi:hypothetical protein [Psychromicrobium lacuslunae]|uniref:Uncharacterized protein n=1 Tax=Psychromicrobium lacuslunae TaxID=1618207 RepID=A0A0D4C1H1_9MICC|nr:hypothetical protein [Psychromicrobium lacuslunae]AJT42448.1 hypothetical protein UM93_14810 [Psychromicrobium lacuslunae]
MSPEQDLKSLAIDALRYQPTENEIEDSRYPPSYPTPSGIVPFEQQTRAVLQERVEQPDDNPMIFSPGSGGLGARFASMAHLVLNRNGPFGLDDAVCVLIGGGVFSVEEAHEIVEASRPHSALYARNLQASIVSRRIAEDDLEAAASELGHPDIAGFEWSGWRCIGRYHADRGDTKAFFAIWKNFKAGQQKHSMPWLKQYLVSGVAAHQGWEAAVKVTADKRIGEAFLCYAFTPLIEAGDVDQLLELFRDDPLANQVPELIQLRVLTEAIRKAVGIPPVADHSRFLEIFERIKAIDPSISKTVMRERDNLLYTLGLSAVSPDAVAQIRKTIRTPWLRADLMKPKG